MFSESDLLPISGLQHILFCERQCALIHVERQWEENRLTAEGKIMHDRVHEEESEFRGNLHICRGLRLRSLQLGLSGVADVVEFYYKGKEVDRVVPVEYKRGKEKEDDCDAVQLCAQAMCLEEMLEINITAGFLYYGVKRRRVEVQFDNTLRSLVAETSLKFHKLIGTGKTPAGVYEKRCKSCSLIDICMPGLGGKKNSVKKYIDTIFEDNEDETPA